MREKKYKKQLCLAFMVMLIAHIFAALLQSDFNRVRIRDMYLVTDGQQLLHALAFIPKDASKENPAPCVITAHGGFHSAEMQDAACIELSRRGFTVIAIDTYSHGMSSNAPVSVDNSINEGNGMGIGDMADYVLGGNMDFIDTDRVGIMGHSMGTLACAAVISNYTEQYQAALKAARAADSEGGADITEKEQAAANEKVKIKAAFCEGMSPAILSGTWDKIHGINIGFVFGIYEELNLTNSTGSGNLLESAEGLEMIHSADPSVSVIENGGYYGSAEEGTLRVFYQPNTTHLTDFISPTVTAQCISFFTDVFDMPADIPASNQLYLLKEVFNLIALIALFFMLLPLADLVLCLPVFAPLRSAKAPVGSGETDRKGFYLGLGAAAVFSFAGFLVTNWIDTNLLLFHVGPQSNADVFPLNECNIVMVWLLIFAAGNFAWFLSRRRRIKEAPKSQDDGAGLRMGTGDLIRTIGAAMAVTALVYMLVWFSKWMFNVDFRFWKVAVKQFNNEKLIYFVQYFPVWFLFMLSASLLTNNLWYDGQRRQWKELLLMGLGLASGGILAWVIQYGKLFATETVLWSNMNGVASVALRSWIMIISPALLRGCYRLTGKNWFGPILLAGLFTLISVSTTTIQNFMI